MGSIRGSKKIERERERERERNEDRESERERDGVQEREIEFKRERGILIDCTIETSMQAVAHYDEPWD